MTLANLQAAQMTTEAFEAFIALPENAERRFELIAGRAVEVPSNPYASMIASRILIQIGIYLLSNDIGHLTGEGGGYQVDEERYAPDVAFISYGKGRELARKGYNPQPPDLAVEVISDAESAAEQEMLRVKVGHYLAAGTLVWVVNWARAAVEVYEPGGSVRLLGRADVLDGGAVLPGFSLRLVDVFGPVPTEDKPQDPASSS